MENEMVSYDSILSDIREIINSGRNSAYVAVPKIQPYICIIKSVIYIIKTGIYSIFTYGNRLEFTAKDFIQKKGRKAL